VKLGRNEAHGELLWPEIAVINLHSPPTPFRFGAEEGLL
jgi:hypothetical protein